MLGCATRKREVAAASLPLAVHGVAVVSTWYVRPRNSVREAGRRFGAATEFGRPRPRAHRV